METKDLLSAAIVEEINNLRTFEPDSSEHSKAVDNVRTLYNLQLEEIKLEQQMHELEYKTDIDEVKYKFEREKFEEEKKSNKIDRILRYTFEGVGLGFSGYWLRKGLKFEETGAFTSTVMRQHILPLFRFRRK